MLRLPRAAAALLALAALQASWVVPGACAWMASSSGAAAFADPATDVHAGHHAGMPAALQGGGHAAHHASHLPAAEAVHDGRGGPRSIGLASATHHEPEHPLAPHRSDASDDPASPDAPAAVDRSASTLHPASHDTPGSSGGPEAPEPAAPAAPDPAIPGCPLAAGAVCAVTLTPAPVTSVASSSPAAVAEFAPPAGLHDLLHVRRLLRPPNA
jgi:hypothetical protein